MMGQPQGYAQGHNPYFGMNGMGSAGNGYQGGQIGGSVHGSMNPSQGQSQGQMGQMGSSVSGAAELKPFDAGNLKAGRLGHYGYLEGRGE